MMRRMNDNYIIEVNRLENDPVGKVYPGRLERVPVGSMKCGLWAEGNSAGRANRDLRGVRRILLPVLMMFLLLLPGCGNKEADTSDMQETIISAAGTITLYHVQGMKVEADTERFQLKQPDSLSASVEEVATAIQLPDGITFENYSIDADRVIHLMLTVRDDVSAETCLLAKVAVIRSMNGLSDARNYIITLTSEEGEMLEEAPYTENSFYYYETGE